MRHYQVVKDDRVFGAWTSRSDVGQSVDGAEITWEDYLRAEDAYISAIRLLARAAGGEGFTIRWPELDERNGLTADNFHDGAVVTHQRAEEIARRALRQEGIWCALTRPGRLVLSFGFDFQLRVSTSFDISAVAEELDSLGLRVYDAPQYAETHEGEEGAEYLTTAADNAFWNTVADRSGQPGVHLLWEIWASGSLGEHWYRLRPGATDRVRRRVHPRSLVAGYFGIASHTAEQARQVLSALTDDDPEDLAERRWLCAVERAGSPVLAVTRYEDAAELRNKLREGPALPEGAYLFPEPEDVSHRIEAVVPDPDGTVVQRWPLG
ncbi:hypothetical protein F4561_000174 [Lipingzhangella halophila]|uniref:Uncharacterized protein n=1 Tax=Lipingzhangella halophila TaxID=1783352 RepID=A0A7W7W140_9ACTN|nr:hypothetical protein [Lipingzhangella halophila]MBB4929354.1 hypothetical protein [Lipingzhangella halophila]